APAPGPGEPRPRAALLRAAADRAGPPAGRVAGRALDRAPSRGRRLLGGDPATVGLLAHGPSPVRLPACSPGDEAWSGRARSLHGRGPRRLARGGGAGGRQPAPGSVPVAGVGHGVGDGRAAGRGRARGRPGSGARRTVAARRGGRGPPRLVGRETTA